MFPGLGLKQDRGTGGARLLQWFHHGTGSGNRSTMETLEFPESPGAAGRKEPRATPARVCGRESILARIRGIRQTVAW